jgi:pectinesterase
MDCRRGHRPVGVEQTTRSARVESALMAQSKFRGAGWTGIFIFLFWVGSARADITVATDGSGQFKTIQEALDSAPKADQSPMKIFIKPGVYREKILIDWPMVHLVGTDADATKTVVTFDDYATKIGADGKPLGMYRTSTVTVRAPDFHAENLTFENTASPRKIVAQAVAMDVVSDRAVFRNCRFSGNQDTLYANSGRQYYWHCLIRGDVDFIFGNARAFFDQCEIQNSGNGGYVTAQSRRSDDQPTGYVLSDCNLTAMSTVADGSVYLGRPWRPYARVVYLRCVEGPHINAAGWRVWHPTDQAKDQKAFYAEYQCTGPGFVADKRVEWSKQLSDEEAKQFEKENFLKGDDGWAPWEENLPSTQP